VKISNIGFITKRGDGKRVSQRMLSATSDSLRFYSQSSEWTLFFEEIFHKNLKEKIAKKYKIFKIVLFILLFMSILCFFFRKKTPELFLAAAKGKKMKPSMKLVTDWFELPGTIRTLFNRAPLFLKRRKRAHYLLVHFYYWIIKDEMKKEKWKNNFLKLIYESIVVQN